jgi:hypothetical protein
VSAEQQASHEALIASLAQDEGERRLMLGVSTLLTTDVGEREPPPELRVRVLALARDAERGPVFREGPSLFARAEDLPWTVYADGVEMKVLFRDEGTGARTLLIRMEPNRPFPPHAHEAIEDLYLISGEAWVDDVPMRAGDYCRAEAGSAHTNVRSGAAGALAVVISR